MAPGEDIISGEMAGERSVRETKMTSSRLLKILPNYTRSSEDKNKVAQEEEADYRQEFLKTDLIPT